MKAKLLLQIGSALIGLALVLAACAPLATDQVDIAVETDAPPTAVADTSTPASLIQQMAATCSDSLLQTDAATIAGNDPDLFAWLMFLYINCPSGDTPPSAIWETWKPNYAVYLPGGATPDPWGAPLPPRMLSADPEISGYKLLDDNGNPALYEIRMNKDTFEYIVSRQLYSRAGQLAFFNAPSTDPVGAPVVFPTAALEIKAVWLILEQNDPRASRYYTTTAQYVDENGDTQTVFVGLSGLHITSKVLPNWLWATFEQVDNQTVTPAPAVYPVTPTAQTLNDEVHAAIDPQSVWQYYNLRGTQTTFTDANNQPTLLANTLIETDFQKSSSCITCHALASRGSVDQGRLAFFNTANNGIAGYIGALDDPNNTFYDADGDPVCYNAAASAFTACNDNTKIVYKLVDFVWSLREAQ